MDQTLILLVLFNVIALFSMGSVLQVEGWTIILVLSLVFSFTALILHERVSKRAKKILDEILVLFAISSVFVLQLLGYKFKFVVWLCCSLLTSAEFYLLRNYLI